MAMKSVTSAFSQFLRLAFFRSPNYVAGASGWTINQDGSVEFNNGTFRGNIVGGALFIYTGAPGLGNPPQLAIVAAGVVNDPSGNAVTSSKILMQANTITESGGIFRTAAASPLIQLDGPHNAVLLYNAASGLAETVAPVGTSDGLGSTVIPGFATYTTTAPFIAIQVFGNVIQFQTASAQGGPWTANGPSISFSGGTNGVVLSSGTGGLATAATLQMGPGASQAATLAAFSGPTALSNSAAPSSALAINAPILFGSSGHLKVVSSATGGDGGTYGTERAVFTAAGQLINSLTPATITGIGVTTPVAAGKYLVRGCIIIGQGGAGAGHQGVRFVGPAISSMHVSFLSVEGATIFNSGVLTALSTDIDSGAIPINTTAELHFDGIITFSASGSMFGMQADCITSATDTWTLSADSYLELLPL